MTSNIRLSLPTFVTVQRPVGGSPTQSGPTLFIFLVSGRIVERTQFPQYRLSFKQNSFVKRARQETVTVCCNSLWNRERNRPLGPGLLGLWEAPIALRSCKFKCSRRLTGVSEQSRPGETGGGQGWDHIPAAQPVCSGLVFILKRSPKS